MKMDVSQLCDRRIEEIKRQEDLARCREREEKRHRAQARANKPKEIKDRHIQSMTNDAPIDTSVPLQQIPASPRSKQEVEHQTKLVVVSPALVEQESYMVDMYHVNPDEENVVPEQNAPEERIDKEIEMEKAVSSPLKEILDEPSGSTKEGEKVEGEQIASQGNTPTVSSSGAPAPMEVDPAPGSLASQPEQEEKKFEEPMAHEEKDEEVAPPVLSHHVVPLIRLQRIYNFLLLHAIILSTLDVLYAFICYFI